MPFIATGATADSEPRGCPRAQGDRGLRKCVPVFPACLAFHRGGCPNGTIAQTGEALNDQGPLAPRFSQQLTSTLAEDLLLDLCKTYGNFKVSDPPWGVETSTVAQASGSPETA